MTIQWGDGQTALGTVSMSGGGFSVAGTHTYAAGGTDAITVNINDSGGGSATARSTALVAANTDAALTQTGLTIHALAAVPLSGTVAIFSVWGCLPMQLCVNARCRGRRVLQGVLNLFSAAQSNITVLTLSACRPTARCSPTSGSRDCQIGRGFVSPEPPGAAG